MAKDQKAADSGTAEVHPAGAYREAAEVVAPAERLVEDWALEHGYLDVEIPHPHYAERGWKIKTVDVGAGNRALFAFAKAYFAWAIGKKLTEAQFLAAMDEVKNRKFQ